MSRQNRTLCVLSLALTAAASAPLCAATLYVPSQYATIQDAINAASNGDGVVVADGTYQGVGFEEIDFLGKALKVRSANGAANCILSTKGARFFHFQNGEGSDSSVSGFTMQYGNAQYNGGAILCDQAGPTVLNCVFLGNFAADGGAIACFDGDLTVRNCVFDQNTAQSSGSAIFAQGGSLVVSSCTFTGNDGVGGTLYNTNNTAMIDGCTFDGNTTLDPGSAITNYYSDSTITGCTINGNTGTAVYNYGATVAIASCGITNNAGSVWGGGMFSRQGASVTVDDCRFSGNSGNDGGAAFVTGPYLETPTSVEFTSCTFTGNSAINRGGAVYNWLFANVTMRQCDFTGNSTGSGGIGGAVYIGTSSDVRVGNCFFAGNNARLGGAVGLEDEPGPALTFNPLLVNCVFSGNSANAYGGGVYNDAIDPLIGNCTFSANTAVRGGGIFSTNGTAPTVRNSILWGNSDSIFGGSPSVTWSDVQGGYPGAGNINADPDFVDPDGIDNLTGTPDDNLRLLSLSPCINAGNNGLIPMDGADVDEDGNLTERTPLDLDRHRRVAQTIVDMGAYERQP